MKKIIIFITILALILFFSLQCNQPSSGGGGHGGGGNDDDDDDDDVIATSRFVTVGGAGQGWWSIDHINWNNTDPWNYSEAGPYAFSDIAYGNGRFVAIGGCAHSSWSVDASIGSWTFTLFDSGHNPLTSIAFGNGRFVTVGINGFIAWSTNGVTWTSSGPGGNIELFRVAYCNGYFMTVGFDISKLTGTILRSTDGTNWADISPTANPVSLNGVTYGNGTFVVVGSPYIFYSINNGDTWTSLDPDIDGLLSITYGNGRFVAVGGQGKAAWSTDGIIWNAATSIIGSGEENLWSITYGNGFFVAIGFVETGGGQEDGQIWYSTDGNSWNDASPGGNPLYGITYGP